MRNPALSRSLELGVDQRQIAQGYAGFQKSVPIMGGVGRPFSSGNSSDAVRRSGGVMTVQQDFGRLGRFLGSSQLRERRRPHREHLEMIGIDIQGFARPGQRRIILLEQIMAERVQCRPLYLGSLLPRCTADREQFDGLSMLADSRGGIFQERRARPCRTGSIRPLSCRHPSRRRDCPPSHANRPESKTRTTNGDRAERCFRQGSSPRVHNSLVLLIHPYCTLCTRMVAR